MASLRILERVVQKGPVLLATLVGVLFALWTAFGGYSGIEATTVNARFKLRNLLFPWDKPPHHIIFIDIDDDALESAVYGDHKFPRRWPWPRWYWSILHEWFAKYGIKPAAVIYDIVFDSADTSLVKEADPYLNLEFGSDLNRTSDQEFQFWLEKSPEIPTFFASIFRPQGQEPYKREDYEGVYEEREEMRWFPPPPSFTRFGFVYEPEIHGKVFHAREIAIPWDSKWWAQVVGADYQELEFMGVTASLLKGAAGSGTTTMNPEEDGVTRAAPLFIEYDGRLYPSLPLQVVLKRFGTKPRDVRFEENYVVVPRENLPDIRIPVDERKRILLNFRYTRSSDPDKAGFRYINYWKLVEGFRALAPGAESRGLTFNPRELNDRIVIIGSSAEGTFDLRAIPIDQRYPAVGTIGTVIRSIEQEDFLWEAPPIVNFFWIIGGAFLVGCLGQIFAPIKHAVATILLVVLHALSTFALFVHFNGVVDFIHVTFAEIMAYAVVTVSQYLQVSSLFGRYVTPEVRRFLMSKSGALQLGGQETEVSILFSDLKGFTSMSEKLEATQVISALNDYFGPMFGIIIDDNYGTLDKLIGDAIMAYFGHPLPNPNHPVQAVTAALMMQRRLEELRQEWEREGKPTIRMRIGVNTGTVVAGNMGSAGRTDYSIIGDNVNLASRLESNAPVDGVLISESTYERTKDHFVFKEREPIQVKGKEKPVKVYEVVDFK